MTVLRGVVIGLGSQGCNHALTIMAHPGATLVAVADVDERARLEWAIDWRTAEIPVFGDVRDLLMSLTPDFAIIAVPPSRAMSVVRQLCELGVSCLMEKPLASDLEKARAVVGLPGFADFVMVAAERRYSSLDQSLVELLSTSRPSFFTYIYRLGLVEVRSAWRSEDSRGCLVDMGYHVVDRVCRWFGYPASVRATIFVLWTFGRIH